MKTATHLLCTVAVVVTSSHHRCSAYVTAPSSFGIKSYATRAIRGKKGYSTIGTSRASTCMYSVPYLPSMEEEGDDGSFFLSASQQAANERYELLKQGKDPLAISLSIAPAQEESQEQEQDTAEKEEVTAAVNESDSIDDNTGVESLPTLQTDDYDNLLSSLSESPLAQSLEEEEEEDTTAATELEEGSSASSTLDEIKRVEDEITAVKSQIKYKFQKRLMDTRMQFDDAERVGEGNTAEEMEAARNARLAAADQVKQVLVSGEELEEEEAAVSVPTSTDSTSTVDAGEGSTAEEMEEARKARLAEADEIAKTLKNIEPTAVTAPTTSTVQVEEEVEEETIEPVVETSPAASKIEEEPSNANQSKLSSDGKVIYEPSQAALDINQENVDNGLMVLTRSFLVLNSIVQRLDEDKK
ncbi:hypothetical protein QTG54_011033 [Skeletonema marinoi]|uniref:Fibrous sheath-interacting protein 1 n=1 Tax=Skeletonema marinoi TaxID=267567 RepID=A0AAD8Y384_9STRA|nr:hypothetical protein QTG54_011033 [Skeletonema marinoi]